jgi:hypothetical protein
MAEKFGSGPRVEGEEESGVECRQLCQILEDRVV